MSTWILTPRNCPNCRSLAGRHPREFGNVDNPVPYLLSWITARICECSLPSLLFLGVRKESEGERGSFHLVPSKDAQSGLPILVQAA